MPTERSCQQTGLTNAEPTPPAVGVQRTAKRLLGCLVFLVAFCGCGSQPAGDSGVSATPPSRPIDSSSAGENNSRRASLSQIRQHITAGRMNEAHRMVQQHLLRFPDDPDALLLAAQTTAARGEIDAAVALLDDVAELSAKDRKQIKARAADLLARSGKWEMAIDRLERLVEQYPQYDRARHTLADLLNVRGYRFDANEHIRQLCRTSGATVGQLQGLISPSRSFATFDKKPSIDVPEEIEKHGTLSAARALFGEGDVRDALAVLDASPMLKEQDPCADALYGQVLIESQQLGRFEQWLAGVQPQSQRYPSYWMAVGGWALHQRRFDAAVRMFAEAVLREPGDAAANLRLTQALEAAGQREVAAKFRKRNGQINHLVQMTREILRDPSLGPSAIGDLSNLLSEVGRPLESLAWHQHALARAGAAADAMQQVEQARRQVIAAEAEQATFFQRQQLCGLDLDDFPLDTSLIADSTPPQPGDLSTGVQWPAPVAPVFTNVAAASGLGFRYRNAAQPVQREFRIFQAYGAGVACIDYDHDGRVDFYVGQAAGEPPHGLGTLPNLLARNLGDRFRIVTDAARCDDRGYTCGVTSGDWNQDGFADLVIGNVLRNRLLINQGDGTFRQQAVDDVWESPLYTTGLAIADVDGDHLPDIVEVNYLDDPSIYDPIEYKPDGTPVRLPGPLHFRPAVDRVFRSLGDGSLRGQVLGPARRPSAATGLGIVVTDLDGKRGNEIFVANDLMANQLWNFFPGAVKTEGSWIDTAVVRGVAYGSGGMPLACMGVAVADFDGNGRLDLHVTNFEDQWSNHYMQNADGYFTDMTLPFGLDRPSLKMLGFGTQAMDYDNNSTIDLVVGNGHIEDNTAKGSQFEMPTQLFAGQGSQFVELQPGGDSDYWNTPHLSRSLAICDWNNDGRTDFVVTDLKQPLALLENRTPTDYHWLQLELVGTASERDAVGAIVTVTVGKRTMTQVVQTGDGYMSKNQSLLSFGLSDQTGVQSVRVQWPSGTDQTLGALAVDRRWLIVEGCGAAFGRTDPGP